MIFAFRRFVKLVCLLTVLAPLMVACSGLPSQPAPDMAAGPNEGYLLEPGNRVRITVFNETNLSGDFTIDPAGNIAMPLAGNVPSSGLTAKLLARRVEDALAKGGWLREPKVAVEVQTFRPFYVLGEVRQPGEFPYTTGMTVLTAIAKAGGYDYRARKGEVELIRAIDGQQRSFRATEMTQLQPGDIVRVVERYF